MYKERFRGNPGVVLAAIAKSQLRAISQPPQVPFLGTWAAFGHPAAVSRTGFPIASPVVLDDFAHPK